MSFASGTQLQGALRELEELRARTQVVNLSDLAADLARRDVEVPVGKRSRPCASVASARSSCPAQTLYPALGALLVPNPACQQ